MRPSDPNEPSPGDPLLRGFLAGEPAASRQLERWTRDIVRYRAFRLTAADREDIVQDTLVGVWKAARAPQFQLRHGLKALVRRVAVARTIDRLRRRRLTEALSDELPDPAPDPVEALLRRERDARLRWALGALEERCRDLIRLHFFEQRPYADIAAELGRAESTMRVHMFHCMQTLRRLVAGAES